MSFVHMIITKDDQVYFITTHYRPAKKIIEEAMSGKLPKTQPVFIDGGYVLIDMNKKIIVNGQITFPLGRTVRKFEIIN